jgi:hypothetical protein
MSAGLLGFFCSFSLFYLLFIIKTCPTILKYNIYNASFQFMLQNLIQDQKRFPASKST